MAKDIKKAVLSNKIYLNLNETTSNIARESLVHTIQNSNPKGAPYQIQTYSKIGDKFITYPIGRMDLIPKDYKIIDKRILRPINLSNPNFSLRESQQKIYDSVDDNCLINARVGWGKTYTALSFIDKLKQKTLIIVHTVKLRDQWQNEIYNIFGIKCGIIGSGTIDSKPPIVVSNIQTLTKHIDTFTETFGMIIVDECHHVPANTFKNVLDKFKSRYKIGLSATIQRKDNKHALIYDYISPTTYTPPKENVMEPLILTVETGIRMPGNYMVPWANRVNDLIKIKEWSNYILEYSEAQAKRGHVVLVLGDRVEFLHKLSEQLDNSVCITSAVTNQEELLDLLRNGQKQILFGSISMFKEGISENYFSCLILASPINNANLLTQVIGRVIRKSKNKKTPEIIDLVLDGATGRKQFLNRLELYRKEGYEIIDATF